ncbi:hypothetical protein P7C71_g2972, partial [Lecanoromycetidae sp. Uapishka_2]
MPTYPIHGIPPPSGGTIPQRREIDDWWDDQDCAAEHSLFVRALTAFKNLNPLDEANGKLSYYQIAGIHGMPNQTWDGAPPPVFNPKDQQGGYCAHNLRIWEIMRSQIADFVVSKEEQDQWYKAADNWRLPYWDWGVEQTYSKKYGVPHLLTLEKIEILAPGTEFKRNDPTPWNNPLYKFVNPLGVNMGNEKVMGRFRIPNDEKYPWDKCVGTSRYGIFDSKVEPIPIWIEGVVKNDRVNAALEGHQWYLNQAWYGNNEPIKDVVYRLFNDNRDKTRKAKSWGEFASTHYNPDSGEVRPPLGEDFLSLELIHNNIHNWTGGSIMNQKDQGAGHMSDIAVAAFDPIFWLHHSWTSELTRSWTDYGYQYDDLSFPPNPDGTSAAQTSLEELRKSINKRYGVTRRRVLDAQQDIAGLKNDYIVNIVYDRFAFNGSPYTIHLFLGQPESNKAIHLGSVYNFNSRALAESGACANCEEQRTTQVLSKASVPITTALLKQAQNEENREYGSLHGDSTENYLEKHLTWRVTTPSGPVSAETHIPGLKVFAMKGLADHFQDDTKLSQFHSYKRIKNATKDKVNGLQPDDDDLAFEPVEEHSEL